MTPNNRHPHTTTTDRLLTPAEVADYCRVSSRTVRRAIQNGSLRASRLGSRSAYRVRFQDIEAWIVATTVLPSHTVTPSRTAPPSLTPELPRYPHSDNGRLTVSKDMGRHEH